MDPAYKFLLETKQLTKEFPGVVAVNEVDFQITPGEIHALLGENGAGKSTFCKLLSGVYQPTSGRIFFNGVPVQFHSTHDALLAGISMVYQERNLIPFLTGAQNICLGIESGRFGLIDRRKVTRVASEIRDSIGADVDLNIPVEELSLSEQQLVEILRALIHKPKLLLLDEPTASLSHHAVTLLHEVVKSIRSSNVGVIYISHKLEEIFEIADRVSIMRDGKKVVTKPISQLDRDSCIKYMTNQDIKELYPVAKPHCEHKPLLEVKNLCDGNKVRDASFSLHTGEIIGFYGLIGSGRTEVANLLFGITPATAGKVILNGQEVYIRSPRDAMQHGIFLIPEDRTRNGLFDLFTVKDNLTIAIIDRFINKLGLLANRALEKRTAENIANRFKLVYTDINQDIGSLSGGNKQKVLLARWLARQEDARVVIFDEPTQGIDVGVKHEIYELLRDLADKRGLGVIFISSELPEVLGVSDRLYVFKQGAIVKEFRKEEKPTQQEVLNCAF